MQNNGRKSEKIETEAEKSVSPWWVGGRGGVQQRLLESARIGKSQQEARSIRHASCPCKQGAADLNGSAIPADPQNMNKYKTYEVKYAINHKKNIKLRINIIFYVYNEIRKIFLEFSDFQYFYSFSSKIV